MPVTKNVLILLACSLTACSGYSLAASDATQTPSDKSAEYSPNLESVRMNKTEGCMEGPVAQFGRYIGDWDIRDWQLQKEKGWVEQKGARWNFTCVGNGVAVQDFWMPPNGGTGTNLRMFDPKTETWQIAWTATGSPGFTHITAEQDDEGRIIMNYVDPKPTPPRRIIFYPPTEIGWDWGLEISPDEGKTWRQVYKIKATRRP